MSPEEIRVQLRILRETVILHNGNRPENKKGESKRQQKIVHRMILIKRVDYHLLF